jgi:hypothetical protein
MSFLPPEGPPPELSTTRVSSGRSARLMAVGVAALLVGVVGFVVVNRPLPPPAPSPTAPVVAVAPTAAPTPVPPVPTATPYAGPPRNQLEGNDGIFGWAVVEQLAYLNADPLAGYTGPRGPGLFNRCRWGFGPQGAPPRDDHDEAGCLGE